MTPEQFLELMQRGSPPVFLIGTIPDTYAAGRPTIQFDGETAASTRTYPYLDSYAPTAEDRVLVAIVNNGAVVLGKIV